MQRPETALDSWREWDAPVDTRPAVIRELGGGRSNRSFLLESGSEKFVLRINAAATALPNPDRAVEARVWRAASEAGIAPPLIHADSAGEFLVSTFIESELPEHPQRDPEIAAQALELLRRIHQLDILVPVIDYAAHISAYWQRIENRPLAVNPDLLEQREPMRELLLDLCAGAYPQALCHHDLVIENFVGTPERLYLIDWEYAALGLVVMDYAALQVEWDIDEDSITRQSGFDPELLSQAKSLYRYMCELWEAPVVSN